MGNRAAIVPFDGRIASSASARGGRRAIDTDHSGQKAVNQQKRRVEARVENAEG
jgi:hypothetical protein